MIPEVPTICSPAVPPSYELRKMRVVDNVPCGGSMEAFQFFLDSTLLENQMQTGVRCKR